RVSRDDAQPPARHGRQRVLLPANGCGPVPRARHPDDRVHHRHAPALSPALRRGGAPGSGQDGGGGPDGACERLGAGVGRRAPAHRAHPAPKRPPLLNRPAETVRRRRVYNLSMHRRQFLAAGGATLALSAFPGYVRAFADTPLRVGLIGSGWYGKVDLLRLVQVAPVEVVSLCDVDSQMLSDAADLVATRQRSKQRPRTYADYRKMLAERDLDLVIVATPDHWHALPMIAAVEAGADVYVQKPISVDIAE